MENMISIPVFERNTEVKVARTVHVKNVENSSRFFY